ncbi:MAG: TonB-dependent receptor plug domain-containing protein [Crocinitomicaceae bacterium]
MQGRSLKEIPVIEVLRDQLITTDISHSGPSYVMEIELLEKLGVKDVGEALKYVPGVQMKDYGGIGGIKSISYRSLNGNYTSLQLDHLNIANAQTGVLNLTSFQLNGVSKISFSSGQSSDVFAMPSTYRSVNTISIRSTLFQKPASLRLELAQMASTIHAFSSGGYFSTPIGKSWHVGGQALTRYGSGEYKFIYPKSGSEDILSRTNSELLATQGRILVGYQRKRSAFQLSGSFLENNQQLPGAVILYNPSNDQQLSTKERDLNLQYQYQSDRWVVAATSFYRFNYTHYYDPEYLNFQGYISSTFQQQNKGGGLIVNRLFKKLNERIFAGIDLLSSRLESNQFNSAPQRLNISSVVGVSKWLGRMHVEGNVCGQIIWDRTFIADSSQNKIYRQLSPYLAVSVLPFKDERFKVRSFFKHSYRVPTFNDLYYNFIGNTSLRPEKAYLLNVGLTYAKSFKDSRIESSVDGYFTRIRDKILAIPTKDIFNWSMQNLGLTEAIGIDISFSYAYHKKDWNFILTLSQNMNSTRDITDPLSMSYDHQLPYTPKLTSSIAMLPSWKGYGISVNGIFSGKRYALNENIPQNLLDPFVDINLGLEKEFSFGKSAVWCSAKVMNVLGRNYEIVRSFPMPGRYYQFTLKFKYK